VAGLRMTRIGVGMECTVIFRNWYHPELRELAEAAAVTLMVGTTPP
jgi:hypothetical protein